MSVSKKLRALNRARTEHDNARLSAQFAASKDTMNHIADSVMAKEIERQAAQIDQLRDRLQSAATDSETECERKLDILRAQLADKRQQLASRDAEVAELVAALERMRVAGGSQEFHIAWELAKDVLDKVRKP